MKFVVPAACVLVAAGVAACNKSDTRPTPSGSTVAASMPDAGSTPTAAGQATVPPHGTPPPAKTLSDTHPTPAGPAPTPPPQKNLSATPTSP
jgi:hypothetical protein